MTDTKQSEFADVYGIVQDDCNYSLVTEISNICELNNYEVNGELNQIIYDNKDVDFTNTIKSDLCSLQNLSDIHAHESSSISFDNNFFRLVYLNDVETLKKVLNHPIYTTDDQGLNLLQLACREGYYDIAEYLLSIGFDVNNNVISNEGFTILQECVVQEVYDKIKLVKLLIDQKVDVNARDPNGRTALHFAAINDLDTLKYFIDNNIYHDIYDVDNYGSNILHIACFVCNHNTIKYLLSIKYDINKCNNRNQSALHLSVNKGDIIATVLFINQNIDISVKESGCNYSALHFTSYFNQLDILKYFIDNNIYDNIYDVDNDGNNILLIACSLGNHNIIEYLLSIEYNINKTNNANQSALHLSVNIGDLISTKLLLYHNIDINIKESEYGYSALHIATYWNHIDILKYFIVNYIYNIYDIDNNGNNIFHIACEEGHYDIVEYLISIRYDVNINNNNNQSGYSLSLENGRNNICGLLTTYKSVYSI